MGPPATKHHHRRSGLCPSEELLDKRRRPTRGDPRHRLSCIQRHCVPPGGRARELDPPLTFLDIYRELPQCPRDAHLPRTGNAVCHDRSRRCEKQGMRPPCSQRTFTYVGGVGLEDGFDTQWSPKSGISEEEKTFVNGLIGRARFLYSPPTGSCFPTTPPPLDRPSLACVPLSGGRVQEGCLW